MKISGRICSEVHGEKRDLPDAQVRLWLIKRPNNAEIPVFDGKSADDGSFWFDQDYIGDAPFTPQYFSKAKYCIEKKGYRKAEGIHDLSENGGTLDDILLEREALQVLGRVVSHNRPDRPVHGANVTVLINNVERARMRSNHEGAFERDIDGAYKSQTLNWTVKRFGYIGEKGTVEIRSNRSDLKTIDLIPHWWTGLFQKIGLDPEVGVGVLLSLGLLLFVAWWAFVRCPEGTVKADNFTKAGASSQDVEIALGECLSVAQGKCGEERDGEIVRCMTAARRGYQFAK